MRATMGPPTPAAIRGRAYRVLTWFADHERYRLLPRRTQGTAVFAGMSGVMLFGIFPTPVFYPMILWFKDRHESAVDGLPRSDVHE
jgi:hypothetical protein